MINPNDCFAIMEHIPVPEEMELWCMCQPDKTTVDDDRIVDYVWDVLLPALRSLPNHPMDLANIRPCAYHVNLSTNGVTPHNHLPHALTTVLYVTDADGALVVEPCSEKPHKVYPRRGRMVVMHGSTMHGVEPSFDEQFRISLVVSYEFPTA
jgi:hypothetical protein